MTLRSCMSATEINEENLFPQIELSQETIVGSPSVQQH